MKSLAWEGMQLLFHDEECLSYSNNLGTIDLFKQREDSNFYKM